MDRNELIPHIYEDYVAWCKSNCIKPETFATFYNQVKAYSPSTLEQMKAEYEWLRMMDEIEEQRTPILDMILSQQKKRIQPNDEERAVAEVIRMLGGER